LTHWQLQAPVAAVWAALTDAPEWPHWWPQVHRVETLRLGRADGVGTIRRLHWTTRLPYRLVIEVETLEAMPLQRLRGRSRGQLDGEGIWELRPTATGTELSYLWRVDLVKPWMRWLAPLLARVFRWNHEAVMRDGELGLQRYLAAAAADERRPAWRPLG
jgi:uncharacterized protein YndB with AHSA1/START domain